MSINGTVRARPKHQAIVDTGTTLFLVDDATCAAIYAAIPGSVNDPNIGYTFPASVTLAQLPLISYTIGSSTININPKYLSYTYTDSTNATCYGLFQSNGNFPFDIAGDGFLRNTYSVSDYNLIQLYN
jgi:hypothetical protein